MARSLVVDKSIHRKFTNTHTDTLKDIWHVGCDLLYFFHFSAVLILGFYFVWEWFEFYRKRGEKQLLAICTQNVFV